VLWLAPRRPHVLACGLREQSGALSRLHEALGEALAGACEDWLPDRRALRPHVTVARVRRGARPAIASVPPAPQLRFSPPALVLMRSRLGPGGARYEALERRPLLNLS
jgi:2'-5' RNA ligase